MARPCRHISRDEVQSTGQLKELGLWKPEPFRMALDLSVAEELQQLKEAKKHKVVRETYAGTATAEVRQAKVFRLATQECMSDERGIPEPRPIVRREVVATTAMMESQDGMGVRSCSRKLWRAEHYAARWHRGRTSRGGGSGQAVDQAELDKVMKELGI